MARPWKTTLELRPAVNEPGYASSALAGRTLAWITPLLVATVLLLSAPGARGAAADYPSPLYLSAAQSSEITASKSYELLGAPGLAAPSSAPSVTATAGGSLNGTYRYVYSFVDPVAGETAPSPATQGSTNVFANLRQFTVSASGLAAPDGTTVRLYRFRSGRYNFVTEVTATGGAFSYLDNTADATVNANPVLPQAENRLANGVTGFAAFSPGTPVSAVTTENSTVTAAAPTTPTGRGWIVDGPGNVHFVSGQWSFALKVKNYAGSSGGVGELRAAMWKVKTNGGAIVSSVLLLDANTATDEQAPVENISTTSTTTVDVAYRVSLPAFLLAADEHLYVELFRYQTTAYATPSGGESRIATLSANDGVARIQHPAASDLPATPTNLRGLVDSAGVTLRWDPPAGNPPAEYVIYVNGTELRRVDGTLTEDNLAVADPADAFSLAAADEFGNVSSPTEEIVRQPKLRGLGVPAARTALSARGLSLGTRSWKHSPKPRGSILSQSPSARNLVVRGGAVGVRRSDGLIRIVSARRLRCVVGGRLKVRAELTVPSSSVSARFYTNGRWDSARSFGARAAGTQKFRMRIPYSLERPTVYWVLWKAKTASGTGKAWVRIDLRRLRAGEDPWPCVSDA